MKHWREILSRSPLPMLSLSASYGVYSFALLSVPWWVALIQATAFEATYVGLSVVQDLNEAQRKRATAISVGSVAVSIIYNSLASLFHRNPHWLIGLAWYYEVALAVLHGAPLALVAYCVADLLLHSPAKGEVNPAIKSIVAPESAGDSTEVSRNGKINKRQTVELLLQQEPQLSTASIAEQAGVTPQYVRKLRAEVR